LLSQIRNDWIIDRKKDFLHLCVCSDPRVEDNEGDSFSVADCDFPVSTSADEVRRFLDFPATLPKVVFCTYQSTHVIVNAGRDVWDLGIFDEAHKTAGRQGRSFSAALDDGNVPIRKRVFFTATPRHCNLLQKDDQSEAEVLYSMDDEAQYGKVAYELSCRKAVELGIICDYKVLVTFLSTVEVNDWLLQHGRVPIKPVNEGGDFVTAWDVANQLAITKAYDEYGIKKTFSFHSRVKAAKDFVSDGVQGISSHLKDVECRSVDGSMNMGDRRKIMEVIKDSPRALLANAKCLTEGVNLPSVDCVAFLSPKRSRIDVAQAMGRGMRKNGGSKKTGYVIVPVYVALAEGENFDEAIKRAKYDTVLEVLQTLKEIDESFADFLKELAQPKKRAKGSSDWKLSEHIEFIAPTVLLEQLTNTIQLECFDRLVPSWDKMYAELVAYKEIHGHCNVAYNDGALGEWCVTQRRWRNARILPSDRIAKLEAVGFCWDLGDAKWDKFFAELLAYKSTNGDCNVPYAYGPLGEWVAKLRYGKTPLSEERRARLVAVGFCWDPLDAIWEKSFAELVAFRKEHGHCIVVSGSLGVWVKKQRGIYKKGKLLPERIAKLESLQFCWDVLADAWDKRIADLTHYKNTHGNCNAPGNTPLAQWIRAIRHRRKKGELSPEQIAKLDAVGFCWDLDIRASWDERFAEVVAYKGINGNCDVPAEKTRLGKWCSKQRVLRRQDKLTPGQIAKLDALGFCWNPRALFSDKMYVELVAYKEVNGNCGVTAASGPLGAWCNTVRQQRKKGRLTPRQIAKLDALGFRWNDYHVALWDKKCAEAEAYYKVHGHCNVSERIGPLGDWCSRQRLQRRQGRLTPGRIAKLDALGFCW
jgi:superfamily II DNA or RNA helicase